VAADSFLSVIDENILNPQIDSKRRAPYGTTNPFAPL
jgi:hypothetical protein